MKIKKNIKLKSKCDGLNIYMTVFIPDSEIKGIVQISHGMAEHKERYYEFMEFLAKNGYASVINDHRGHGMSINDKEDLGYFYDTTGMYITEDLHQVSSYIKEMIPDKKLILFGHSMGSMVVRDYLKKYDSDIDKLIVCGSPSKNHFAPVALFLAKVISSIKGDRYRSNLIQNLAFGSYDKKFTDNEANSWICANKEIVKEYNADSLCSFTFTANGFQNLFKLMISIYSKKGWILNNEKIPIYFIAGSDDAVIINQKKWVDSQNFLKSLGYQNVNNKLYSGFRHEILNEKNNMLVYKDILNFIEND